MHWMAFSPVDVKPQAYSMFVYRKEALLLAARKDYFPSLSCCTLIAHVGSILDSKASEFRP
jgi:hypothetical protein